MRKSTLGVLHSKESTLQERSLKEKARDKRLHKGVAKEYIFIIAGTAVIYTTTESS